MNLSTKVSDAGKNFQLYASRLANLNVHILRDLLYHLPFRYEDFTHITPIKELHIGETATIIGEITKVSPQSYKFKKIQKITVSDGTGEIEITWFNQPFLLKTFSVGAKIALSGRVERFGKALTITAPEHEMLTGEKNGIHTGRLVPIYPETKGVSSKWLRRQIYTLLHRNSNEFQEYLPLESIEKHHLPSLSDSLYQVHFPDSLELAQQARKRLAFDELLLLQLQALERKTQWKTKTRGNSFESVRFQSQIGALYDSLPFTLTNAQQAVITDIFEDMAKPQPMNRLVQGDVGSGKTIVAAVAMYLSHLNGFQSVMMAPTEILAGQHYASIHKLLSPFGVTIGLATGSKKHINGEKLEKEQHFDIMIGTHAVLSEKINYTRVGLVVIDEQQRFGVEQRSMLRNKGANPHVLTMTATPIPRTIALTMYGDLDLSLISEMPKGRKVIKTWLVPEAKRNSSYDWMRQQVKETNSQIFIICPFIEESETMVTIKAVQKEFERLTKDIFPDLKMGLLHGKLKPKEKDTVLQDFKDKKYDILVATPVVEVGIDIPNATVIVIEAADRFGLAGLHQLRGRVGRGDKQSYCLLFMSSHNPHAYKRLKALETIYNGAELAELDLQLRGPGEMYGTMQSGVAMFKIASLSDTTLILSAKQEAEKVFPKINDYPKLLEKMHTDNTSQVSPD